MAMCIAFVDLKVAPAQKNIRTNTSATGISVQHHITQAWWPSAVLQGLGVRTQRSSALGGSVSRQAHDTAWESYVDLFAIQPQQMSLHGRPSVLGEM
jgi:hypothetical protein